MPIQRAYGLVKANDMLMDLEFELVTVEDVKKLLRSDAPPVFNKVDDPFKPLRRRQAPIALEGYAISWMAKLPREAQPCITGEKYPRIVNKLAALWGATDKTGNYLRDLLVDTRGSRKGFPPDVSKELHAVRAHLQAQFVIKNESAWSTEKLARC